MSNCIFILCTVVDRRFYSRNYYYFRFVFLLRTVYVYVYVYSNSIANCFKYHHTKHLSSLSLSSLVNVFISSSSQMQKIRKFPTWTCSSWRCYYSFYSTLVFIDSINNNLTQLESNRQIFSNSNIPFSPFFFNTHINDHW